MKNLNKNILRYLGKNKFITLSLSIFIFLVSLVFNLLQGVSTSMDNSYNNLVDNYNLHNVVIYDNWNQNSEISNTNKAEFYEQLAKLGVYYREFESINVYSSNSNTTSKIIKYQDDYLVDQLDVFEQKNLISDPKNGHYLIPSGWNLDAIVQKASENLGSSGFNESVFARQLLVYFAANSTLNVASNAFYNQFSAVLDHIYENPQFDPLNPSQVELANKNIKKVREYISMFVDKNDPDYTPPAVRGSRIAFIMQKKTSFGTPLNGYYEDPTCSLAVVNPNWLKDNNKEVLDFNEFVQAYSEGVLQNSSQYINHPTSILDLPRNTPNSMDTWINSLDDKYKVYANNIPYVIVGTGITPDMMFPIVSFESLVPNSKTESIVYTNYSGYQKADFSFQSMYHENFILGKYVGDESKAEVTSKLNSYVEKYMAWPANIQAVYWYNDQDNTMSPATLRVTFITQLLSVISGVTYAISIFILILLLIVLCLFAKMYITQNKNNIAILMSNGINKWKIISNMSLMAILISVISIPIGYFIGAVLQPIMYSVFSSYWMIPVSFSIFDPLVFFLLLIIPTLTFVGIIIFFSWFMLRKNVPSLLKEDQNVSLNKSSRIFKSLFNFAPLMVKFRGSLAFNSFAKIIFLTLSTITLSVAFTFVVSTTGKIQEAYEYELKSNKSAYELELVTPTIQSGQYYGVGLEDYGRTLINQKDEIVAQNSYSIDNFYKNAWNNSPLFKKYSLMHWASANDSDAYTNNIIYLKNLTEILPILDLTFGVTGASTNPMDIVKSVAPSNQIYGLYQSMLNLTRREMSDMRPFNQAYGFIFNKNGTGSAYIAPSNKNSIPFPKTWAIQNFGIDDPNQWELDYNNDPNIGVISAPEVDGLENINDVLKLSGKELAAIINNAYSSYNKQTDTNYIPPFNDSIKYYSPNNLFWYKNTNDPLNSPSVISNIRIDPNNNNVILFDVDVDNNINNLLLTNRSLFTKYFYTIDKDQMSPDEIKSLVDVAKIFPDPFNENTYYKLNTTNALGPIPMSFKTDYINYVLLNYLDPVFTNTYFRIQYNQIIFNDDEDEPYVHVDGRIMNDNLNNDLLNIIGIQENSKFINLYDNKNNLINSKLFATNELYPLIINNFVAKKYDLDIGSQLKIYPENNVYRKTLLNNEASKFLDFNSPNNSNNLNYQTVDPITFTIVGINNTGNGVQMYTNINCAQKALGLATSDDYKNNTYITTLPSQENNYQLNVGMNNNYNTFGGFNGILTSNQKNVILTQNLTLYSLSGMYIANDSWDGSAIVKELVANTLNNTEQIPYLANAFNISVADLQSLWKKYSVSQKDEFVSKIIDLYCTIYGKSSLNATFENADSVMMSEIMFNKMSTLYDQISIIVVTLIMLLSLICVILCSIMIINDMLKLIAIMKTLGYLDKTNALNIIVGYIPSWLLTIALSAPISILAVSLFKKFVFTNLSIYIGISVNWPIFVAIQLLIAIVFAIIYGYSIYHFKKKNILSTIRW